jgi:predicted component of type VI protein secretion system
MKIKQIPYFLSCLLFLSGCLEKGDFQHEAIIQVMVPPEVNRNTPFYMVAKTTDTMGFYMDDYTKMIEEGFSSSENQESFIKDILVPGSMKTVKFPLIKKGEHVAVYFLFTSPDENWKVIFDRSESKNFKILLGQNGIESTHSF